MIKKLECPICKKMIGEVWYLLHVFAVHSRSRPQHTGRFM